MANIKKTPSHKASLSYNGFDMSQRNLFTSSVGQLLPVYFDYLSPGEKIKGGASIFTRTQPLQSTAFARMTEHVDYFFVPFSQLYSGFNSKFFNIQDINSSILSGALKNSNFPHITKRQISTYFHELFEKKDSSTFDKYNVPKIFNGARLLECLGYGFTTSPNVVEDDTHLSAFPLLAYHKIYNDYYRLSNYVAPKPKQYNYDTLATSPESNYIVSGEALELHYRPWKKDYFTNIFPTPFFDNASPSQFMNKDFENLYADGKGSQVTTRLEVSLSKDFISQYGLAPQNLRSLLAVEKLNRITQFAGKHYDKQVLAHFGFSVPQGVTDEVYYLGSNSSQLNIQEVTATAGTDNTELGQLAGRGISSNGDSSILDFTAPCHGIFMAIYSAVPESDYEYRYDRLLSYVTPEHFYRPEYDNLGMQPIYYSDFIGLSPSSSFVVNGWQYMYSELKTKYDKIQSAFVDSLKNWVGNRTHSITNVTGSTASNVLSKSLDIDPRFFNNIFLVEFEPYSTTGFPPSQDSTIHYQTYARDPLLHSIMFDIKKISTMSTYSLPKL